MQWVFITHLRAPRCRAVSSPWSMYEYRSSRVIKEKTTLLLWQWWKLTSEAESRRCHSGQPRLIFSCFLHLNSAFYIDSPGSFKTGGLPFFFFPQDISLHLLSSPAVKPTACREGLIHGSNNYTTFTLKGNVVVVVVTSLCRHNNFITSQWSESLFTEASYSLLPSSSSLHGLAWLL